MVALQRQLPVASPGQAHADCHQPVDGPNDSKPHKRQLYEAQRPLVERLAVSAPPPTGSRKARPGAAAAAGHESYGAAWDGCMSEKETLEWTPCTGKTLYVCCRCCPQF